MTEFGNKLANKVFDSEEYCKCSSLLFDAYLLNLIGELKTLKTSDVSKLLSSAQIFIKSDDKRIKKEGAVLLSMILEVCASDNPGIVPIANSMFIESGDFPNLSLLEKKFSETNYEYDFITQAKYNYKKDLNSVSELAFTLTDYQRLLWEQLSSDHDVITSAPTSAGKTHIIISYLINKLIDTDAAFVAILVPTRALISEVSGKIYELIKEKKIENDIDICTIAKSDAYRSRTFFVMTQERLNDVILQGDIFFDYLFIDEAHNISDKTRGVLLHMIIERMTEDSFPQIIISMPSSNYQNCFSSIFDGIEFIKEITEHSPVAKLIFSVEPKGRILKIHRDNSTNIKEIPKNFSGTKLANIVYRLGSSESNIIYRNRPSDCENIANEISSLIDNIQNNELLEEAANYIENFIHEEFSLASNLRKGVAFHYGPLPSSVRIMIENLVKEDLIKFIACTSTLAEGVNLPAKNLFLKNPLQIASYAPSKRIEDVKIKNITGRAGRMLHHFSGNIFLIEPDKWTYKDYLIEETKEEEKIPTYFKSLNDDIEEIISFLKGSQLASDEAQPQIYNIANKLLKEYSNKNLNKTFDAKEINLNSEQLQRLENSIKSAYEELEIATFTLEANPSVGYIQQNYLFKFLNGQENIENWLLPFPHAADFYDKLLRICDVLVTHSVYLPSNEYALEHICIITRKWINGISLKEIITDQITYDSGTLNNKDNAKTNINSSVRSVIKIINGDIQFRLANSLRCYQMLLDNILINKGSDSKNIKLHSFIEVGASTEQLLNLINMGISRESSIDINKCLNNDMLIKSSIDLLKLLEANELSNIHSITKKELEKLFG